ncbi:MAG: 1-deoxy-D-xylulose-5-phosphate reductoisomerase [Candidatus Omnitrophota bacterium]
MKRITVLGSTGSIGVNTLKVVRDFPGLFKVAGLSTNSNTALLYHQIRSFRPEVVAVADCRAGLRLKERLRGQKVRVLIGEEGLSELAGRRNVDKVVLAISGSSALGPLLSAINNRRVVALANKEALVMAGELILPRLLRGESRLIPIDSEQSAIWQCLEGEDKAKLKRIYLTASGGPLRKKRVSSLRNARVSEVLRHPRWNMGRKISVDSATLMNKGLEVLEAMYLFGVAADKIKVLVHPEAVIHSMVEFTDGVILAQLSATDMRIPIQYALSYPERLSNTEFPEVDFLKLRRLNFEGPDLRRFPALGLAYLAAEERGTMPAVLNAANEIAVEAFLENRISFTGIAKTVETVMQSHKKTREPSLADIMAADEWARNKARALTRN